MGELYRGEKRGVHMPDDITRCTSCGIPLSRLKDVKFDCPSCGNFVIGRCANCRDQSAIYVCPDCGFSGP
jgi:predicted RNA-binding Zn-ribbon protein involved in translation (DUF1610 family)